MIVVTCLLTSMPISSFFAALFFSAVFSPSASPLVDCLLFLDAVGDIGSLGSVDVLVVPWKDATGRSLFVSAWAVDFRGGIVRMQVGVVYVCLFKNLGYSSMSGILIVT